MPGFVSSLFKRVRSIGWREVILLLTLGAISGGLWLSIEVSDWVMEDGDHAVDERILVALRQPNDPAVPIGPGWVKTAALDITALGSAPVLTLIVVLICGFLLLERKFSAAGLILFASLTGTFLNHMLKNFFGRERPDVVPHLAEFGNSSFPSGHSMLASIIYLTLAALLTQTVKTVPTKMYLIAAAFLMAFLVGLTRVILGVHYPSDVLVGWTGGTAWALLCWMVARWLRQRGKLS
jgi:undecaprenyl-diphosphatase